MKLDSKSSVSNVFFFFSERCKNFLFSWVQDTSPGCVLSQFSRVQLFVTLWTMAHQTPLSIGFSKQEYWNGLRILQGVFPTQGWNPPLSCLLCWQAGSFPLVPLGKPPITRIYLGICPLSLISVEPLVAKDKCFGVSRKSSIYFPSLSLSSASSTL